MANHAMPLWKSEWSLMANHAMPLWKSEWSLMANHATTIGGRLAYAAVPGLAMATTVSVPCRCLDLRASLRTRSVMSKPLRGRPRNH
jgi:hypothetical protein